MAKAKSAAASTARASSFSPPPEQPAKPSLVDVLTAATATDLEAIDREIAVRENELDQHKRRLAGEIASLRTLRKVVNLKVNGKQPKCPRRGRPPGSTNRATASAAPGEPSSYVATIGGSAKLISRIIQQLVVGGPQSAETLASKLSETAAAIRQSISRCPDQVKYLSGDGRYALPGHQQPGD